MALQSGGPTHCKETLPPRQSQLRRTSAVFVITSSPGFVLSPPKKQKKKTQQLAWNGTEAPIFGSKSFALTCTEQTEETNNPEFEQTVWHELVNTQRGAELWAEKLNSTKTANIHLLSVSLKSPQVMNWNSCYETEMSVTSQHLWLCWPLRIFTVLEDPISLSRDRYIMSLEQW